MTLTEFNAWLEGFEEAIDGTPTKAQWKKIRAKMATVTPDINTSPVYPLTPWPATSPIWNEPVPPSLPYYEFRPVMTTCTTDSTVQ